MSNSTSQDAGSQAAQGDSQGFMPRRVVITGVGAVSPVGIGADVLFDSAINGVSGIKPISGDAYEAVNVHVGGTVTDFNGQEHGLTKKESRRWERFVQFAAVASDEAMLDSGMATVDEDGTWHLAQNIDPDRFAVIYGSGIGGMEEFTEEAIKLSEKGAKRVSPLFVPTIISNIAAGELAIRYGLKGECNDCVVACATGTQCIGSAFRLIRFGYADYALAGGSEESVNDISIAGFSNLGALTHETDPACASRPFDINRSGFVAGEGAGALVLESLESALARGASILAEIVGFGATGDAYHITSPDPSGDGIVRAMRQALDEANMTPQDIGHLNAHGTSTPINDATESKAFCTLQGTEFSEIPVTSTKGISGHMLGAAGAIEAIVAAKSAAQDIIPMTVGFSEADPECPVTVYTETRYNVPQKVVLSNSIGFGGHNATLAIAPYK